MSRAFLKEDVGTDHALPERVISPHRNLVTASGLARIDGDIARLRAELTTVSPAELASSPLARDLRYWLARRASAELVEPVKDGGTVRFGTTVTIDRDDGATQRFRVVGEDEADPKTGTLSYTAPLARALFGKEAGDELVFGGRTLTIVAIG